MKKFAAILLWMFVGGAIMVGAVEGYYKTQPCGKEPTAVNSIRSCQFIKWNDRVGQNLTYIYDPCPFKPDIGAF